MNIRSDTINDLQWQDIVVGTRSPTVGSETVPCFREDGERGTVTGGLGFQCRRLLKGTGVSPSATRGTGWSEETWGWQDPTFHCRNHLPGPAHPLTPLCSVKTLLCENCARVAPLAKKKKKARVHVEQYKY